MSASLYTVTAEVVVRTLLPLEPLLHPATAVVAATAPALYAVVVGVRAVERGGRHRQDHEDPGAHHVDRLARLRVEFLDDSPAAVGRIIGLYREVLEGRRDPKGLWRDLKATGKYGVTRGALAIL